MPQFDQYGMGVLVIATIVVFAAVYMLFSKHFQAFFKMTLGVRERLVKKVKSISREMDQASQFGESGTFNDEFYDEKVKAAKRMNALLKKKSEDSKKK